MAPFAVPRCLNPLILDQEVDVSDVCRIGRSLPVSRCEWPRAFESLQWRKASEAEAETEAETEAGMEEMFVVGMMKIVSHPALDAEQQGVKEKLAEASTKGL